MTLSQLLTSLGDAVRSDYLITDKLAINEMTDLLSGKNDLTSTLGTNLYVEDVAIAKEDDAYLMTPSRVNARVAIPLSSPNLVGKKVCVYFQASTDSGEAPLQLGPWNGNRIALTVKGKSMTGYYVTLTFTANNSLSMFWEKVAPIKIKNLRAWLV